ncbi:MAG: nucleotidyltransferase domain-containing protein [Bacteroidales bacterium]|nr:nucleotidyltransferase domain-containing protein [Bacteroidales bacterium]
MNIGVTENSLKLIIETIAAEANIRKAILYGSRALGNAKKGSDIDIAIQTFNADHTLSNKISTTLNQELPIPYYVDVIDYDSIENKALKKHIDQYGKVFYEKKE